MECPHLIDSSLIRKSIAFKRAASHNLTDILILPEVHEFSPGVGELLDRIHEACARQGPRSSAETFSSKRSCL